MARKNTSWLEFKGRRSTECGVSLMDGIVYARPGWRGKSKEVTGRSGDLWQTSSTARLVHETVDIKRRMRCRASNLEDVAAWLTGSGQLVFSWAPDRAYQARAAALAKFEQVSVDSDPLVEFEVEFTCQPYRLIIPAADPITVTTSGAEIVNPGTAPAASRVKITGNGEFSITIGMDTLFFTGVTGGIIVDAELMDALTYDGTLLANGCMEGEPWQINPGVNVVSWQVEDGSAVDAVEITPRWRCI